MAMQCLTLPVLIKSFINSGQREGGLDDRIIALATVAKGNCVVACTKCITTACQPAALSACWAAQCGSLVGRADRTMAEVRRTLSNYNTLMRIYGKYYKAMVMQCAPTYCSTVNCCARNE